MNAGKKVTVDILATNARSRNMVELALTRYGKGRFEIARGPFADVVVLDCDGVESRNELKKYRRRNPARPVVALVAHAAELGELAPEDPTLRAVAVSKPLKVDELISSIDACMAHPEAPTAVATPGRAQRAVAPPMTRTTVRAVATRPAPATPPATGRPKEADGARPHRRERTATLSARRAPGRGDGTRTLRTAASRGAQRRPLRVGAETSRTIARRNYAYALSSDIDITDRNALAGIRVVARRKLLGRLLQAVASVPASVEALCVAVDGGPHLYVSPAAEQVGLVGDAARLADLAQRDLDDRDVQIGASVMPAGDAVLRWGLEPFLWRLGLQTYRGLLPEDTEVDERVYLSYWPNFTRLDPVPNAMRIASLWTRQPVDLAYTIRTLRVPQRHVFSFYAAAHTIGLAGPARRGADSLFEPSQLSDRSERTLFERLARRLSSGPATTAH